MIVVFKTSEWRCTLAALAMSVWQLTFEAPKGQRHPQYLSSKGILAKPSCTFTAREPTETWTFWDLLVHHIFRPCFFFPNDRFVLCCLRDFEGALFVAETIIVWFAQEIWDMDWLKWLRVPGQLLGSGFSCARCRLKCAQVRPSEPPRFHLQHYFASGLDENSEIWT